MKTLLERLHIKRSQQRPRPEEEWRDLITRFVPQKSFIDVGCMWNVHGACLHAAAHGTAPVVGLDVTEPTPEFIARNAELGERVRFVQADINDPDIDHLLGETFEVIFCSGVLCHVPNPLLTLDQLRRLCLGTLILSSAIVSEREDPHSAIFLP